MGIKDWFSKRPTPQPVWRRPFFEPGGRKAEGEFFCYSEKPIPTSFDLAAFGYPEVKQPGVGVRSDGREDDPDSFASGLASLAESLPSFVSQIESVQFRHVIVFDELDPKDLGYLQAAWASVRYFLHHGALVVHDLRANRWRTAREVLALPADDPTQACAWRIYVESEPTSAHGCLTYSSGLAKFGRPDLIAAAPPKDITAVSDLLNKIAADLANGRRPILSDGAKAAAATDGGFVFEAYVPGFELPPRDFFNDEVLRIKFV